MNARDKLFQGNFKVYCHVIRYDPYILITLYESLDKHVENTIISC